MTTLTAAYVPRELTAQVPVFVASDDSRMTAILRRDANELNYTEHWCARTAYVSGHENATDEDIAMFRAGDISHVEDDLEFELLEPIDDDDIVLYEQDQIAFETSPLGLSERSRGEYAEFVYDFNTMLDEAA